MARGETWHRKQLAEKGRTIEQSAGRSDGLLGAEPVGFERRGKWLLKVQSANTPVPSTVHSGRQLGYIVLFATIQQELPAPGTSQFGWRILFCTPTNLIKKQKLGYDAEAGPVHLLPVPSHVDRLDVRAV